MHKTNGGLKKASTQPKNAQMGFWNKFFRVFMSVMLVFSLIPATPANATENEEQGEGQSQVESQIQDDGQNQAESEGEGQGKDGRRSEGSQDPSEPSNDNAQDDEGQDSQAEGTAQNGDATAQGDNPSNPEELKKTPEVTAKIVGYKPADDGWTDNEGTIANGAGYAVVSLSAAFGEDTEDSVAVTLDGPNNYSRRINLSTTDNSSEIVDVKLPQAQDTDSTYSFTSKSSDITVSYGSVDSRKVLPDNEAAPALPSEITIKQPYSVKAFITYSSDVTPTTESPVYANVKFEGSGFTKDVVVTYTHKNMEPTTVTLNAENGFAATVNNIDEFTREEGAEINFDIIGFSATYECADENSATGNVLVDDHNGITIDGVPQVDSSNTTIEYVGGSVYKKDESTLVANDDVTAIITVRGSNFSDANSSAVTYALKGDATDYPFACIDATTLTATIPLTPNNNYPADYVTIKAPKVSDFSPEGQTAVEFDTANPEVSVLYEVSEGGAKVQTYKDEDGDAEKQTDWFDLPGDAAVTVKLIATDSSGIDTEASMVMIDGAASKLSSLNPDGDTYTVGTFKASEFFNNNTIEPKELTFNVLDNLKNLQDTSKDNLKRHAFASDTHVFSLFNIGFAATSGHDPASRAMVEDGEVVYDSSVNVKVGTNTAVWEGVKNLLDWSKAKVSAAGENGATLSVENGKSLEDNTYEATLATDDNTNTACEVTLALQSVHGSEYSITKSFSIDTTTPTYSATLNKATASFTEGENDNKVYVFGKDKRGKDKWPVIDLVVTSTTSLQLEKAGKGLKVFLTNKNDANEKDISDKASWQETDGKLVAQIKVKDLSDSVEVDGSTAYSISVAGSSIFNQSVGDKIASDTFLIDHAGPEINVSFSGPVSYLGELARFFAKDGKEIGSVTITVEDRSLYGLNESPASAQVQTATGTLDGVSWDEVDEKAGDLKLRRASVLYASADGKIIALGESNNQTLKVTVCDRAGNETLYAYDGEYESIDGEKGKAKGSEFVVDISAVKVEGFTIEKATKDAERFNQTIKVVPDDTATEVTVTVSDANFDSSANSHMTITKYVNGKKIDETEPLDTVWTQVDGEVNTYAGKATINAFNYGVNEDALKSSVVTFAVGLVANDTLPNATTKVNLLGDAYIGFDPYQPETSMTVNTASVLYEAGEIKTDCYDASQIEITVEVKDPYFDSGASKITRKDVSGKLIENDPLDFVEKEGMDNVFIAIVAFDENSAGVVYDNLAITVNDVTGNHRVSTAYGPNTTKHMVGENQQNVKANQFIVDAQRPKVHVDFDQRWVALNSGVDSFEAVDASKPLTATISVEDNNFDPNMVSLKDVLGLDGDTERVAIAQNWTQDKDEKNIWRAMIQYKETIGVDAYKLGTSDKPILVMDMLGEQHTTPYSYAANEGDRRTTAKDANGNEKTLEGTSFIYDCTKPTITRVDFSGLPVAGKACDEDKKDYYNAEVSVKITVEDNNLDKSRTTVNGKAYDTWIREGTTWTLEGIEFAENTEYGSDYGLDIAVNDTTYKASDEHKAEWHYVDGVKNGDKPATGAERFVVDMQQPKISAVFNNKPQSSVPGDGEVKTRDYYNNNVQVTLMLEDLNLSNASIETIRGQIKTLAGINEVTVLKELSQDNLNEGKYTAVLEFDETVVGTIYDLGTFEVHDKVARLDKTEATHKNSVTPNQFFVDKTDPHIDVVIDQHYAGTLGEGDNAVDYFDTLSEQKKITATLKVKDSTFINDAEAAAIKPTGGSVTKPWYQPYEDQPDIWFAEVQYDETPVDVKYDLGSITIVDRANRETDYYYGSNNEKTSTVDSEGKKVKGKSFVVDVQAPSITVRFDQNVSGTADVSETAPKIDYYATKNTMVATVSVIDNNFDPNIKNNEDNTRVTPNGSYDRKAFESGRWTQEGNVWTRVVTFTENEYSVFSTLGIVVQDKVRTAAIAAGNNDEKYHNATWDYAYDPHFVEKGAEECTGAERFVIDTISPRIDVTLDKNVINTPEESDNKTATDYFAEELAAKIVVTDANLDMKSLANFTAPGVKDFTIEDWKDNSNGTYETSIKFGRTPAGTWYDILTNDTKGLGVYDMAYSTAKDNAKPRGHNLSYNYAQNDANTSTKAQNAVLEGTNFFVDTDTPQVDVVIDQHYAGSLGSGTNKVDYYDTLNSKGILRATLTVTDRAFRPAVSQIPAIANGTITQWSRVSGTFDKWVATVDFPENAHDVKYSLGTIKIQDWVNRTNIYHYGDNNMNDPKQSTKAGRNNGELVPVDGKSFVVDATQPKITVSFGSNVNSTDIYPVNNSGNVYNDSDYYDVSSLIATITVKDNNFDQGNTSVSFGDRQPKVSQVSNWTQNGDTWTAVYRFDENDVDTKSSLATYTQDLVQKAAVQTRRNLVTNHTDEWKYATGKRNNAAPTGANYFVLDHTAPTIRVEMSEYPQQINYQGTGIDYYAGTAGDALTATVRVNDNNFDPNTNLSQIMPIGQFGRVEQPWVQTAGTNEWVSKVVFFENSNASTSDLNISAQDFLHTAGLASGNAVGNHTARYDYGRSETTAGGMAGQYGDTFILDYSAPIIAGVTAITNYSGIYAQAEPLLFYNDSDGRAGLTLDIADNNGLEKSKIDSPFSLEGATSSINALRSANVVRLLDPSSYEVRNELNRNIEYTIEDHSGNYSVWLISPQGRVSLKKTGRIDARENTLVNDLVQSTHPERLVLDHVAPVLSWATSVQEGAFYNTTQAITLNVEELNFDYLQQYDGGQTVITVNEYAGRAGRALTQWTRDVGSFSGAGTSWAHTVSFETDGHYVLEGKLTDPANNSSQIEFREFTIDKTAPRIISITYDNNDVRNGKYYKAVRTATITVEEHNWNEALENTFITTNGRIGGWTHNGDTHVATVFFSTDGTYNLNVSITDKAGNTDSKTEPEFIIDLTAPKIAFENVTDKTAYGDSIAPHIVYTDEKNFDTNGLQWSLLGAKNGEKKFATSKAQSTNSATISYGDFDRVVETDDIYTLKAQMVDLAGNEANGDIQFSVNRFGSNFVVRNADQYNANGGYLATAPEVIVDEINVTGAEDDNHGVTVTRGLDTKNLQQQRAKDSSGGGFFIDSTLESYGWAHYTYHVGTGNYKSAINVNTYDDGSYHVAVNSQDMVKNNNNSANYYDPSTHNVNNAEVAFTLDTTAPIVENLHFEEGALFSGEDTKVTFTAIDNIGLDNVTYTVNGNAGSFEQGATSEYTFGVPVDMFADTNIAILARDIAGNYSDGTIEGNSFAKPEDALVAAGKVTVRASIWRYVPFIVGGGCAVALGIAVLILVRRKKNNEELTAGEAVQE